MKSGGMEVPPRKKKDDEALVPDKELVDESFARELEGAPKSQEKNPSEETPSGNQVRARAGEAIVADWVSPTGEAKNPLEGLKPKEIKKHMAELIEKLQATGKKGFERTKGTLESAHNYLAKLSAEKQIRLQDLIKLPGMGIDALKKRFSREKTPKAPNSERTNALSKYLKEQYKDKSWKERAKQVGLDTVKLAKAYNKLPLKKKLLIAGAFAAGSAVFTLSGGSASWLYVPFVGLMTGKRVFGGFAAGIGMEATLQKAGVKNTTVRYLLAGGFGVAVGEGLVGKAAVEGFNAVGGHEWLASMWPGGAPTASNDAVVRMRVHGFEKAFVPAAPAAELAATSPTPEIHLDTSTPHISPDEIMNNYQHMPNPSGAVPDAAATPDAAPGAVNADEGKLMAWRVLHPHDAYPGDAAADAEIKNVLENGGSAHTDTTPTPETSSGTAGALTPELHGSLDTTPSVESHAALAPIGNASELHSEIGHRGEGADQLWRSLQHKLIDSGYSVRDPNTPPAIRAILSAKAHALSSTYGFASGNTSGVMHIGDSLSVNEKGDILFTPRGGEALALAHTGIGGNLVAADAFHGELRPSHTLVMGPEGKDGVHQLIKPEASALVLDHGTPESNALNQWQLDHPGQPIPHDLLHPESHTALTGSSGAETSPVTHTEVPPQQPAAPVIESRSLAIKTITHSPSWEHFHATDTWTIAFGPDVGSYNASDAALRGNLFRVLRETGIGFHPGEQASTYLERVNAVIAAGTRPPVIPGVYNVQGHFIARGGDLMAKQDLFKEFKRLHPSVDVVVENQGGYSIPTTVLAGDGTYVNERVNLTIDAGPQDYRDRVL